MWAEFFFAAAIGAVLCYVPGYLFLRGLGFSRLVALCASPTISVALYALLPVLYDVLGISCSAATIGLPVFLLGLAVFLGARLAKRPSASALALPSLQPIRLRGRAVNFNVFALLCYVIPCVAIASLIFVGTLQQPNMVNCQYDNQTHINAVRAFLDSGRWSTLHVSSFLASAGNAQPYPPSSGGFYPAAWHSLAALVCSVGSISVPIVMNALVFMLAITVVPTGMFLLLRTLFPTKRRIVLFGALATSSFATWPWIYVIKGPRYPNMLGLCLMVSVIAIVILATESHAFWKRRGSLAAYLVLSFLGLAIAHPNTLFSAYIILAGYGGHHILEASRTLPQKKRVAAFAAYVVVLVLFWIALYQLPFFKSVLGYRWNEHEGLAKTGFGLLFFTSTLGVIQVVPTLLCLLGAVKCIKERRLWLIFPMVYFGVCFVATRVGWEPLKYWLAGMWYQSPDRFAALLSLWGIPLVAMGFSMIPEAIAYFVGKTHLDKGPRATNLVQTITLVVLLALCAVNYCPMAMPYSPTSESGLSYKRMRDLLQSTAGVGHDHVYGAEEMAFVDKVKDTIPQGALVLNQPNDGSMYAYGANELNTYFRSYRSDSGQTDIAKTIRLHLNELSSNAQVQEAVHSTGAQYLLLLDKGASLTDSNRHQWIAQYRNEEMWKKWAGINAIDDNTPGFTVVLSEGDDLRLYKIEL